MLERKYPWQWGSIPSVAETSRVRRPLTKKVVVSRMSPTGDSSISRVATLGTIKNGNSIPHYHSIIRGMTAGRDRQGGTKAVP